MVYELGSRWVLSQARIASQGYISLYALGTISADKYLVQNFVPKVLTYLGTIKRYGPLRFNSKFIALRNNLFLSKPALLNSDEKLIIMKKGAH